MEWRQLCRSEVVAWCVVRSCEVAVVAWCGGSCAEVKSLSSPWFVVVEVVVVAVVVGSVGALFVPRFGRVTRRGPATTHLGPRVT